ncbi:MAG: SET domain-containing protein [Candidatus Falkowbacteria bacterium]|nr:SET domain-containing protein [Candidatus Falkowbacteria bacterium]
MIKRVKTIPKLIFEIRPSKVLVGEVSVFAVRNLKKGMVISHVDSPEEVIWLHQHDFKKLDPITRRKIKSFCIIDEAGEYCVPADLNNMGTSWYFNHSCSANVTYDSKGSFVAARNIKKDEELFLDYGRMFTDPKFKLKCACGSNDCRHMITGRDWLNPEFRKNNLESMWPEMRKRPIKPGTRKKRLVKKSKIR